MKGIEVKDFEKESSVETSSCETPKKKKKKPKTLMVVPQKVTPGPSVTPVIKVEGPKKTSSPIVKKAKKENKATSNKPETTNSIHDVEASKVSYSNYNIILVDISKC